MKKIFSIFLSAIIALSIIACGTEKGEAKTQNTVTAVESNQQDSADTVVLTDADNMLLGSWYCDEAKEVLDFTDSTTVIATTPMVNITGSYKLDNGKLIISYDIGDDIYEYELSNSTLILKNTDGTYTFARGTADFSTGDGDGLITDAANDVVNQGSQDTPASTVAEDSEKADASTAEVEVDNTVLASYVGTYKDNLGNTFEVSKDSGYGFNEVKFYSAAGWPEYENNDGVRFYDTPSISSIKQGNGYVIVETISQYILSEGRFKFLSDGSVEVTYSGGTLTGTFSGTFSK